MRAAIIAALLSAVSTPAFAQEECQSYVGQTISLNGFTAVATTLKGLPTTKGEYETTAAFDDRVAKARGSMPETVILLGIIQPKYLTYDADAGVLRVSPFALDNINTSYNRVFGYGQPYYEKVEYSSLGNYDAVLSQREVPAGSYIGSNAFGTRVAVYKRLRLVQAIFQGPAKSYDDYMFVDEKPGVDSILGTVKMTIPEAQSLKATGKVAFVVKPKWPYYAEGTETYDPTLDSPTDVTERIQVVVGDIRCALLMTGTNKVVAAYQTK